MIVKKNQPLSLLSSCSSVAQPQHSSVYRWNCISITSSSSAPPQPSPPAHSSGSSSSSGRCYNYHRHREGVGSRTRRYGHSTRGYASIAGNDFASSSSSSGSSGSSGSSSDGDCSHLRWPLPPKGHKHPTPYQIFSLSESAPYTKHRFYELVKLYHPDRNGGNGSNASSPTTTAPSPSSASSLPPNHPCYNLAHAQKLERYRLIVAAHGILSDPIKRAAYDLHGAGWTGNPSSASTARRPSSPYNSSTSGPNIWANATWEDWERFYAARDPSHPAHQSPTYLRNSYFISIVLVFAAIGGALNYERADSAGEKFLEARDNMHDRASKELRKVRQQSGSRAKEERIQFFVRQREATLMGLGVEDVRRDMLEKILPDQEAHACMSGELRGKKWDGEEYERQQREEEGEEEKRTRGG